MAWNGSGTYSRIHDWTVDEAAGENIEADRMDAEDDSIAAGINACLAKNGENSATADLPMGTNKHTGVGDGSARTHYPSIGQLQDGAEVYAESSGTDTMVLTLSPAVAAYAEGQKFVIKAGGANTGATTLNVNGVGAKNVYVGGSALVGGEIQSGEIYVVVYDGTQFQLITQTFPAIHGCRVYDSTGETITTGANSALECGSENFDTDTLHSTSSNTEKITIPAYLYGIWSLSACVHVLPASTPTGRIGISIKVGSASYITTQYMDASEASHYYLACSGLYLLSGSNNYAVINGYNEIDVSADFIPIGFCANFVGKI